MVERVVSSRHAEDCETSCGDFYGEEVELSLEKNCTREDTAAADTARDGWQAEPVIGKRLTRPGPVVGS